MTEKKIDTLLAIRDTLRYHQAMGIEEYPYNEDVRHFLQPVEKAEPNPLEQGQDTSRQNPAHGGIENLDRDIQACSRCHLASNALGRVSGKGRSGCLLMIVGDWSSQSGVFSPDTLFGKEEDIMLWKMITAMELRPEQIYVTNCLKCCPGDPGIIDRQCEEQCLSFLTREIAAVQPRVICAMGDMPVRVLTGRKDSVSRLRGRFGNYRYPAGKPVVVMPTFHPRFLLQHPDMKKATWNDLQAIKRRLGGS